MKSVGQMEVARCNVTAVAIPNAIVSAKVVAPSSAKACSVKVRRYEDADEWKRAGAQRRGACSAWILVYGPGPG